MKRGQIWVGGLDPAEGHEQKGHRPLLIISSEKFNRLTRVPIVLPITTGGNFVRSIGFTVSLAGAGTWTVGVIRCDQPRALDLAACRACFVEDVPEFVIEEVLARVSTILE